MSALAREGRAARGLWCALAIGWLAAAAVAGAVEPVGVEAEGVAPLTEATERTAYATAFEDALVEAVLEVAARYLPPERLEVDREGIREALAPHAREAVLTYRQNETGVRVSARDLSAREYAVRLTVTVDASQVRALLQELRLVGGARGRPSLVLWVRPFAYEERQAPVELTALEDALKRALDEEGYVIVEPALRGAPSGSPGSALEAARALGADVAVDLAGRWRPRGVRDRVLGGTLELRLRAVRAEDGNEIAIARFEAPGYHADPAEAQARALDALREQVATNLLLQLDQNWEVLAETERPIRLVLSGVSSLTQADRVARALERALGAEEVALTVISPRVVELEVRAPLSPGALQDRLAALTFEGFRLEPVEVERERVELRVALEPAAATPPVATP